MSIMNLSVLKTLRFWLTAIPTLVGLALTSGLVLHGTTVDQVVGWVLAIVGILGGHSLPAPTTDQPQA